MPGREHAQRDIHRAVREIQLTLRVPDGDLGAVARRKAPRRRLGGGGRRVDPRKPRRYFLFVFVKRRNALGDDAEPVPFATPEIHHQGKRGVQRILPFESLSFGRSQTAVGFHSRVAALVSGEPLGARRLLFFCFRIRRSRRRTRLAAARVWNVVVVVFARVFVARRVVGRAVDRAAARAAGQVPRHALGDDLGGVHVVPRVQEPAARLDHLVRVPGGSLPPAALRGEQVHVALLRDVRSVARVAPKRRGSRRVHRAPGRAAAHGTRERAVRRAHGRRRRRRGARVLVIPRGRARHAPRREAGTERDGSRSARAWSDPHARERAQGGHGAPRASRCGGAVASAREKRSRVFKFPPRLTTRKAFRCGNPSNPLVLPHPPQYCSRARSVPKAAPF